MAPGPSVAPGQVKAGSFGLELQSAPWKYTLLHDRPENLLFWITRGQGRITINGVRRGVSMGTAIYLPAGTLFAVDLPQGVQALYLQSPAGLTGRMPRQPLFMRVQNSLAQSELTSFIAAAGRELTQQRPLLAEALESHVNLVAVWLHRQVAAGSTDELPQTAAHKLVRNYAQRLTRGYRSAANMSDYAEALDVTPTHLTRVCRQCAGVTAADMLTQRKLHAARLMLDAPGQPVKDIAAALGFASSAYFTRFIQTHTGKTPTALRLGTRRAPRDETLDRP
jgi:AraC family transcriptional activator of pobA